jgi:hypothetical protein
MPDPGEPKIIIDSDWKAQAQKEKERLTAQEKEAAAKAAKQPVGGGGGAGPGAAGRGMGGPGGEAYDMPPADFPSLVGTIVTQALLYLGGFPDPQTGRAIVSLEHAKFHIDLLAVLQEKTKGNLSKEEDTDLSQALNELRLRFVDISKAIAQMQAKAALEGQAGGPAAAGGPDLGPRLKLRSE